MTTINLRINYFKCMQCCEMKFIYISGIKDKLIVDLIKIFCKRRDALSNKICVCVNNEDFYISELFRYLIGTSEGISYVDSIIDCQTNEIEAAIQFKTHNISSYGSDVIRIYHNVDKNVRDLFQIDTKYLQLFRDVIPNFDIYEKKFTCVDSGPKLEIIKKEM